MTPMAQPHCRPAALNARAAGAIYQHSAACSACRAVSSTSAVSTKPRTCINTRAAGSFKLERAQQSRILGGNIVWRVGTAAPMGAPPISRFARLLANFQSVPACATEPRWCASSTRLPWAWQLGSCWLPPYSCKGGPISRPITPPVSQWMQIAINSAARNARARAQSSPPGCHTLTGALPTTHCPEPQYHRKDWGHPSCNSATKPGTTITFFGFTVCLVNDN